MSSLKEGPFAQSLEKELQRNNIQRQAYHGGAFVGNHINRALQPAGRFAIANVPRKVSQRYGDRLQVDAAVVVERYHKLFSQYSACRQIFSTSSTISESQALQLESNIRTFMTSAMSDVVDRNLGNVTPKLHLLERHVISSVRHFGVGLDLLGEHGGESLHKEFNALLVTFSSVTDKLDRLKTAFKQQCIATLPKHLARPHVQSRQRQKL